MKHSISRFLSQFLQRKRLVIIPCAFGGGVSAGFHSLVRRPTLNGIIRSETWLTHKERNVSFIKYIVLTHERVIRKYPVMPKFYCDYCDRYLAYGSFQSRKEHREGHNHKDNVKRYYSQYLPIAPTFSGGIGFPPLPMIPGMPPPPPLSMRQGMLQPPPNALRPPGMF